MEEEAPPPEVEMEDVELTEEEKATWHLPTTVPDVTTIVLNSSFGKFSIPAKDEGFDTVTFEWQPMKKATEYMEKWVREKKLSTPMEV